MSSIHTIAYASSSAYLFTQSDLEALLEEARTKNARNGLSGILLYHDGNFMQILEGKRDAVDETFNRIKHDPRHKGIIRLLSRSYPTRSFSEWTMGYVRCTDRKLERNSPGFNLILEREQLNFLDKDTMPDSIYDLLVAFHRIVYKTNMKVIDEHTLIL